MFFFYILFRGLNLIVNATRTKIKRRRKGENEREENLKKREEDIHSVCFSSLMNEKRNSTMIL